MSGKAASLKGAKGAKGVKGVPAGGRAKVGRQVPGRQGKKVTGKTPVGGRQVSSLKFEVGVSAGEEDRGR